MNHTEASILKMTDVLVHTDASSIQATLKEYGMRVDTATIRRSLKNFHSCGMLRRKANKNGGVGRPYFSYNITAKGSRALRDHAKVIKRVWGF